MITWFKKLLWVVRNFERALAEAQKAQSEAQAAKVLAQEAFDLIRDRTTVHMDIGPSKHDANVIILVGRYNRKDYVQVYSFGGENFEHVVDEMRLAAREGHIGRVDAPPMFKAILERDSNRF